MNAIALLQNAERRKLSIEDVLAMMDQRILDPSGRYELIDGMVYAHADYKSSIIQRLNRTLPDEYFVMADTTLRLSPANAPSPDLYIIPTAMRLEALKPEDVVLVVEVSGTTLSDDLGPKAALYARHGVQEYWVVDIARRVILVHRERDGDGWAAPVEVAADETAVCAAVPALRLRLADLKRAG